MANDSIRAGEDEIVGHSCTGKGHVGLGFSRPSFSEVDSILTDERIKRTIRDIESGCAYNCSEFIKNSPIREGGKIILTYIHLVEFSVCGPDAGF